MDKRGDIKDSALRGEGEAVVIIDDEKSILDSLSLILRGAGYSVDCASNADDGLAKLRASGAELVLCDLKMPDKDGLDFLRTIKDEGLVTTSIMMSAYATADLAIEAMKLGAYDYIPKPFNAEEILLILRKAIERERLRRENESLRAQISKKYSFANIIARSDSMRDIFETIKKIADYKTTVMIYGESGTGKELIARAIHYNSSRRSKKFVAINCGAIPENLLESELFGHKRGAFTDATRDKRGLFEEAQGGTILLDEIGELPLHLQVKLLRVLQESEIRPVGDSRIIPIDVRVVAATLRDLEKDVLDGRFRDDLFYRLNVVSVHIPPLRERREDIPILIDFFIAKNREKLGLPVTGITKEALALLMEHDWRGNVRELENCIERATILTEGDKITAESLPKSIAPTKITEEANVHLVQGEDLSIKTHTRNIEEHLIKRALERTKGNRTHAARLLEISHRTLLYKLKEYNLSDGNEPNNEVRDNEDN